MFLENIKTLPLYYVRIMIGENFYNDLKSHANDLFNVKTCKINWKYTKYPLPVNVHEGRGSLTAFVKQPRPDIRVEYKEKVKGMF